MEETVRERVYEKNTGAALFSVNKGYICDEPKDSKDAALLASGISILMPYAYKKIIEAVFRLGAMTANAIKNLLLRDMSLTESLRSEKAVERYISILRGKGFLYKCACYHTEDDTDVVRYEYYVIPPLLSAELEKRYGTSFKNCLTDPKRVAQLLSISQIITMFCDGTTDIIGDAKCLMLPDSDAVCVRLKYRGFKLFIASMRNGEREEHIKIMGDISRKLNGRLENTRGLLICENISLAREYADEILRMLGRSELHGIYFTFDFTYTDRNIVMLSAERTLDGLRLTPVSIYGGKEEEKKP